MKREGRQHGMVRTYRIMPSPWNPKPETRLVNRFDSPPTNGLFTKVSQKPTNHSKFTGKCGKPRCTECRMHPACKSKAKTKGTQKLNSRDLVSNYKMIPWRVVDGRPGLNFSGFSATGILDHLDHFTEDYVDDEVDDGDVYDHDNLYGLRSDEDKIREIVDDDDDDKDDEDKIREIVDDDDDDKDDEMQDITSYCDVGMVFDQVDGDEGWCLVGGM